METVFGLYGSELLHQNWHTYRAVFDQYYDCEGVTPRKKSPRIIDEKQEWSSEVIAWLAPGVPNTMQHYKIVTNSLFVYDTWSPLAKNGQARVSPDLRKECQTQCNTIK